MTSSIPSKYETIVINNDVKKAFGITTNRFPLHREFSAGPGTILNLGSYLNSSNSTIDSTIYSKKGLGNGFISKVDRNIFNQKYINAGPGPGLYKQGKPSLSEKLTKELEEKKYLVQFYKKDEKLVKKEKMYQMGPGDYQPKKALLFQNTFTSSFVTKYQRDAYRRKEKTPGPGIYENQTNIYSPKKYKKGTDWFCKEPIIKPRKRN